MTLIRRSTMLGVAFTMVAAAGAHSARSAAASVTDTPTRETPAGTIEVRRIRAHFDSVLIELRARDVSALNASQAARRKSLMETLLAYRNRGEFPNNYDFASPIPYFFDRKTGTRCAVAHLIESTGRSDITLRVARTNNNVLVPDLAGDTALASWLDEHGLTLAEAARIQVPYIQEEPSAATKAGMAGLAIGVPIAFGTSIVTGMWNLRSNSDGHRWLGNSLGFVSGAAVTTIGLMVAADNRNTQQRQIAYASAGIGLASMALATRSTVNRFQIASRKADQEKKALAEVSVTPIVPIANSGAGLSVSIRF